MRCRDCSRIRRLARQGCRFREAFNSNDVVLSETRLTCRDAAGRDIAVEGDRWQRRLSPDGLPVWIVTQVPAGVALRDYGTRPALPMGRRFRRH